MSLQSCDACAVRRMRGGKFRRLTTTSAGFLHALPESYRFMWVITGACHVIKANFIGFGFVLTAERKQDSEFGARSQGCHYLHLVLSIHVAKSKRALGPSK